MTFNRRHFLQGLGAGAGLTALAAVPGVARAASAPTTSPVIKVGAPSNQVPGVYRTQVGTTEITSILDGGMDLGLELFTKTPKAEAEALQSASFVAPGPVKAYVNSFVVKTGGKNILIDTGCGNAMGDRLGRVLRNLAAAGLKPYDINEIYLTHAHIDHVSGLVDSSGFEIFPKARIRLSATELQFWYDDAAKAKAPESAKMLFAAARKALDPYKAKERIETFKAGDDLGGGITTVDLAGHTPGHVGYRVAEGKDQLLIWGDIIHAPVLQFRHPEWSIAFDTDAAKALTTRSKILAEVAADRVRVAGMHLCFPALGHVAKAGTGYDFVPQVWEL